MVSVVLEPSGLVTSAEIDLSVTFLTMVLVRTEIFSSFSVFSVKSMSCFEKLGRTCDGDGLAASIFVAGLRI